MKPTYEQYMEELALELNSTMRGLLKMTDAQTRAEVARADEGIAFCKRLEAQINSVRPIRLPEGE